MILIERDALRPDQEIGNPVRDPGSMPIHKCERRLRTALLGGFILFLERIVDRLRCIVASISQYPLAVCCHRQPNRTAAVLPTSGPR